MCQPYIVITTILPDYYVEESQEFVVLVGLRTGTSSALLDP